MKRTGFIQLLRLCFVGLVILCPESCKKEDIPDEVENGQEGVIAFTSGRDGNDEIYVMNSDGSQQIRLTENPAIDMAPDWSPDGQQLAFVSNRNGNYDIFIMNSDGSNPSCITSNSSGFDGYPSWSPDCEYVAFQTSYGNNDDEIAIVQISSGNISRLTTSEGWDSTPAWK